ncbi:MAG: hypothetical protein RMZ69_20310, partial [Nostoc sp. ChiQUE01a]|nr:hypothetical protein [Nostoc sp. ChiQUE01a]
PHVETRFIASDRPTRSQDAINRRLYRESTRQLFLDRLLFPTCVYTVAPQALRGWGWGVRDFCKRSNEYLNWINPPLNSVNEYLNWINPPLNSVNEYLNWINPPLNFRY